MIGKIQYKLFLLFRIQFNFHSTWNSSESHLYLPLTQKMAAKRRVEIEKCFLWLQPSHLWLFGVGKGCWVVLSADKLSAAAAHMWKKCARGSPPKICAESVSTKKWARTHTWAEKTWKRPWASKPCHAALENRDDKSPL